MMEFTPSTAEEICDLSSISIDEGDKSEVTIRLDIFLNATKPKSGNGILMYEDLLLLTMKADHLTE